MRLRTSTCMEMQHKGRDDSCYWSREQGLGRIISRSGWVGELGAVVDEEKFPSGPLFASFADGLALGLGPWLAGQNSQPISLRSRRSNSQKSGRPPQNTSVRKYGGKNHVRVPRIILFLGFPKIFVTLDGRRLELGWLAHNRSGVKNGDQRGTSTLVSFKPLQFSHLIKFPE